MGHLNVISSDGNLLELIYEVAFEEVEVDNGRRNIIRNKHKYTCGVLWQCNACMCASTEINAAHQL